MYDYVIGVYWIRLANGVILPYRNWMELEAAACAGFDCSRETLHREIAWRVNAGDVSFVPSYGDVANTGFSVGLWTHARQPRPYLCERRNRRQPYRESTP
jgi:hypothetical protein